MPELYGLSMPDLVLAEGSELDDLVEEYLSRIYNGEWDMDRVIPELYFHNALSLSDGFKEGYSRGFFTPDWTIRDNNLLSTVQNNLFAFSGAKTYAEMQELRDLVYKGGKLMPWNDYLRQARKINVKYNEGYLRTERETVIASGISGSRWVDMQETIDLYPYGEYCTQRDGHVRDGHRILDGIIFRLDDAQASRYNPPNDYNCRCYLRKLSEREYAHKTGQWESRNKRPMPTSEEFQQMAGQSTPKMFRHNPGTSGVFDIDGHPYFKASAAARNMQLSAVRNYGMNPARKVYTDPSKLPGYHGGITSEESYNNYWRELERKHGKESEGFTLVDGKNNIMARFDPQLREKILNSGRHYYFDEAVEVFTKPSEVWGVIKSGKRFEDEYFNAYLKYYNDRPVVLMINKDGRVDSFYKLDTVEQAEQFRLGLLKQKK